MFTAAGTQLQHIDLENHGKKSSAASFEIFLRKPVDFTGPKCFHFKRLKYFNAVVFWNPLGRRRSGCPRTSWPSKFISYTRYRHLGNWLVLARDPDVWRGLMDDFCMFCGRE